jgi:hypothetical protein
MGLEHVVFHDSYGSELLEPGNKSTYFANKGRFSTAARFPELSKQDLAWRDIILEFRCSSYM